MRNRSVRTVSLLLASLSMLVGACHSAPHAKAPEATPSQSQGAPVATAHYLAYTSATKFEESRYKDLLPTPPAKKVEAEKDFETRVVWSVRDSASAGAKANALAEENGMPLNTFSRAMGVDLDSPQCAAIKTFVNNAVADADMVKVSAKKHFERLRPMRDATSPAKRNDFSYPSGHATTAAIRARVLAAVASADPSREKQVLEVATLSCFNRMMQNMHFPTDIAAGFALGQTLGGEIVENAERDPNSAAGRDLKAAREAWNALAKK